jgi:hypothetical protein
VKGEIEMKLKPIIKQFAVLIVILILNDAALFAGRVLAQEPQPKSGDSPDAIVSSSFTYQGRLTDTSGRPIAGSCDFAFLLYNLQSGGSPVTDPIFITNQSLMNGYFTVDLNFSSQIFDGTAYWMAISVACPSGSAYVSLDGRVSINATPYAHSLRPGATINGTTGNYVLNITNPGSGDALRASSSANQYNYAAVYGSNNSTGSGVFGYNTGGGYGVYGQSTSGGYGVYGKAAPGGYGLYSSGNAYVDGLLSWSSLTSFVSVSAAAFQPRKSSDGYTNEGSYLGFIDLGGERTFYAPVQLPHLAEVVMMKFFYRKYSEDNIVCKLWRNDMSTVGSLMALTASTGEPGYGSVYTTDIYHNLIDNENFAYYLEWTIPSTDVIGLAVVITYHIRAPY